MSATWPIIKKTPHTRAQAVLGDYDQLCRDFSWDEARALLDYLPDGCLNICHEAIDRHVGRGNGEVTALRWIGRGDNIQDFTYADLQRETSKFANVLKANQIGAGDRVFSLLGRITQLYIAALGTLKNGGVYSPLFAAFGPDLEDEIIDPETAFRDQFEFDSMDFLNFVIGLHQASGEEIPEADYPQLTSLNDCVSYLRARNV